MTRDIAKNRLSLFRIPLSGCNIAPKSARAV